MKQTLFAIPDSIAGLPLFGIGLLLAAWLLFCIGLLVWLLKRYGLGAETRGYLPLMILVGLGIVMVLPKLAVAEEGGVPVRGYGVMMMLGIVAGVGLAAYRAPAVGLDPDKVFSLTFWMFLGGIVGARLFHIIQYRENYNSLGDLLEIQQGGLVVYGALIAALIIVPVFVIRNKIPGLAMADLLAPSMVLGLAFGRIGCLLTGCCFAGSCDLPWAVTFPRLSAPASISPPYQRQLEAGLAYGIQIGRDEQGSLILSQIAPGSLAEELGFQAGQQIRVLGEFEKPTAEEAQLAILRAMYPPDDLQAPPRALQLAVVESPDVRELSHAPPLRSLPVHPVQVYSAINAALLCVLLLAYHPLRRRDGEVFALLITIYPIARFLLEMIRTDELAKFGTALTISQLVSLATLAGAAVLWWYILRQPTGQRWVDRAAAAAPLGA